MPARFLTGKMLWQNGDELDVQSLFVQISAERIKKKPAAIRGSTVISGAPRSRKKLTILKKVTACSARQTVPVHGQFCFRADLVVIDVGEDQPV